MTVWQGEQRGFETEPEFASPFSRIAVEQDVQFVPPVPLDDLRIFLGSANRVLTLGDSGATIGFTVTGFDTAAGVTSGTLRCEQGKRSGDARTMMSLATGVLSVRCSQGKLQ